MPPAPVLIPDGGGERVTEVALTVPAMREASRRIVAANPESLDHGAVVPLWFLAEAGWHGRKVATHS